MSILSRLIQGYYSLCHILQRDVANLLLLMCRLWVGWVFWQSGWIKISSWDSTLYLFELEYQVPLLPWQWAAYFGTAAELGLPLLLIPGLLGRLSAFALFAVNAIAVISYPVLWEQGFTDHQLWGMMLLTVMVWGSGRYSLDHWLKHHWHTIRQIHQQLDLPH
ncbi:DoxX family protein [Vibrio mimicus]